MYQLKEDKIKINTTQLTDEGYKTARLEAYGGDDVFDRKTYGGTGLRMVDGFVLSERE